MDIDITAKIITIRHKLGIPSEGFSHISAALDWYKTHYEKSKGTPLRGGFGYRFGETPDIIQFDYKFDFTDGRFLINFIPPIDKQVPLDVHASSLAWDSSIDPVNAPALRLAIMAGPPTAYLPLIPSYISVDMGNARLLMHPPSVLTEEMRKRILDESGSISTGINQGYLGDRENKKMPRYFDGQRAYGDGIEMKMANEGEGTIDSRTGYLKGSAQRIVKG